MNRFFFACVFAVAGFLIGCDGGGLTPDQKVEANKQWNDARAGVLASLANDQYKSGNLDKCQESLDRALRLEPANPSLQLLAARVCIEQGNLEMAQAHLEQAAKLDPKNGEVDYLNGVLLQRWQQTQKACDAYASAVEKNPTELSYLLPQAEMLVQLNKAADALKLLQDKTSAFEHSGVIRDEIGQILVQQKRYGQAVVVLREAGVLSSDDAGIREHLAFALLDDQQYAEASDVLGRLLKQSGFEKRADLFEALGQSQSQTNDPGEARSSYEQATQIAPGVSGYWVGLAKVATQQGDLPGADAAVRKAISLDPTSARAQCLLGYIRMQENQLPASLAAFHSAAELDPSDSVSVCLQGFVLARMGRKSESQSFYSRALQINPHDELAGRLMTGVDSHD